MAKTLAERYAASAQWRRDHPQLMRLYRKRWKEKHPKQLKASILRYKASPKGKIARDKWNASIKRLTALAKFRQTAKGLAGRVRNENARKARKRNVFTYRCPGDFEKVKERFGYACVYCKATLFKLTEDHLIPIKWGGHDAPWNLVPACQSCNAKKGSRFWAIERRV